MGRRRDDPAGMTGLERPGEAGGPLRQVNPVRTDLLGQGGVCADQQDKAAFAGDFGEPGAGLGGVLRPEGAVDEARARRQAAGEGDDVGGARRIGEGQEAGQGLSPPRLRV